MSAQPIVTQIGPKMRLIRVKCENTKTTCISVLLQMPLRKNTAEHLVLSSYLSHSSASFPTLQKLSERLEELYGAVLSVDARKLGESYCLRLSITCLNDALALKEEILSKEALELLLDLLLNPNVDGEAFNTKQLETELRITIADIESTLNDKRAYALHRMIETMCKNEPFGLSQDQLLRDVKNVTAKSMYTAWRTLLTEAVVSISVAGEQDFEEIETMLQEHFSVLPNRQPVSPETVFIPRASEVKEVTEEMDVNQSKLVLGFRTGMQNKDDNFFAYRVMVDIFGGGPYSRLFNYVREKLSLCYYCAARLDRAKGIMVVQSGIEKKNKETAQKEILKQFEVMKNGTFDDAEFEASKAALCDLFRGIEDTAEGIDAFYSLKAEGDLETPADIIAGIQKVTRADVVAAANRVSLDTVYLLAGKQEV